MRINTGSPQRERAHRCARRAAVGQVNIHAARRAQSAPVHRSAPRGQCPRVVETHRRRAQARIDQRVAQRPRARIRDARPVRQRNRHRRSRRVAVRPIPHLGEVRPRQVGQQFAAIDRQHRTDVTGIRLVQPAHSIQVHRPRSAQRRRTSIRQINVQRTYG